MSNRRQFISVSGDHQADLCPYWCCEAPSTAQSYPFWLSAQRAVGVTHRFWWIWAVFRASWISAAAESSDCEDHIGEPRFARRQPCGGGQGPGKPHRCRSEISRPLSGSAPAQPCLSSHVHTDSSLKRNQTFAVRGDAGWLWLPITKGTKFLEIKRVRRFTGSYFPCLIWFPTENQALASRGIRRLNTCSGLSDTHSRLRRQTRSMLHLRLQES